MRLRIKNSAVIIIGCIALILSGVLLRLYGWMYKGYLPTEIARILMILNTGLFVLLFINLCLNLSGGSRKYQSSEKAMMIVFIIVMTLFAFCLHLPLLLIGLGILGEY